MDPESLTLDLYRRRLAVSERVSATTNRLWRSFNPDNLDAGWDQLSGTIALAVYNGQLASATMSVPYVEAVLAAQGYQGPPSSTAPELYAGVAPDGAALTPLLYGAVTSVKQAVGTGARTASAFEVGAAYLAAVVKTVIVEMGRNADMVHSLGRGVKRYTRAVSPNACSRCAILAGIASASVAFPRHPNCQCVAVPTVDPKKIGMKQFTDPWSYFESLSKAEQDRIFTIAGAQAIRDGADIFQIVNARRGASGISFSGAIGRGTVPNSGRRLIPVQIGVKADGSPLLVYVTNEGTTRRGEFTRRQDPSRRTRTLRLMPEQIYRMAGNDPDRAIELLRRYGYIW